MTDITKNEIDVLLGKKIIGDNGSLISTDTECLETRVGYATLTVLRDLLKDYVKVFTENHRYNGQLLYLMKLKELEDYLKIDNRGCYE